MTLNDEENASFQLIMKVDIMMFNINSLLDG